MAKKRRAKTPPTEAQLRARKENGERLRALNAARQAPATSAVTESEDTRDDDREGEGRRRRQPLGVIRHRLEAKVPNGMVGHWFNDSPGRIRAALDAGYHFIGDDGEKSSREGSRKERVGVNPDGTVLTGYLMAIPKQFYDEDQAAKQREIDEFDAAINRTGNPQGVDPQDSEHFYMPEQRASVRYGR